MQSVRNVARMCCKVVKLQSYDTSPELAEKLLLIKYNFSTHTNIDERF